MREASELQLVASPGSLITTGGKGRAVVPDSPSRGNLSALPVRLLAVLRRKWACPVVLVLGSGPRRFGALARSIPGLRRPVLAAELRRLAGDGLVRKREVSEKPPEVHYSLTAAGSSLSRLVQNLKKWEARYL